MSEFFDGEPETGIQFPHPRLLYAGIGTFFLVILIMFIIDCILLSR